MKRRSDSDVTILNAALRKAEVHIESLQQTIEQKVFRLKILNTVIQLNLPQLISSTGVTLDINASNAVWTNLFGPVVRVSGRLKRGENRS